MKTPHVTFSYNREKDIENIRIGLDTVNRGRQPDRELSQIIQQYGNTPSKEELEAYVTSRWENKELILSLITKQLQEYWDVTEEQYFTHLANQMQLTSFYNISQLLGFLSSRHGSGYSAQELWFAVSIHGGTVRNGLTAMHEIMHIFFHKQWWNFCQELGISNKNMWDVKEAVTVLLNLWFKNQVIDIDRGYEEHTELRHLIKEWFLESRNFKKTLLKACEFVTLHPQKSPNWITN